MLSSLLFRQAVDGAWDPLLGRIEDDAPCTDHERDNALRRSTASQLAALSGGEYVNLTTQRNLEDALQRISNRIHNYYLLSFTPPSVPTFGIHSLRVRAPDYPDAFIQTRKSYWFAIIETPPGDDHLAH